MKFHEWHEQDEAAGVRRYWRAEKFGRRWTVKTTLKTDDEWVTFEEHAVPLDVLEVLRTQMANKYQRRRVPYEDLTTIDSMVVAAGGTTLLDEIKK